MFVERLYDNGVLCVFLEFGYREGKALFVALWHFEDSEFVGFSATLFAFSNVVTTDFSVP